uniref:Uncharacterized protein n=1 Tax=Quercus lobata TaxID=97700 RepID=A0A7N2MR34_QUELO
MRWTKRMKRKKPKDEGNGNGDGKKPGNGGGGWLKGSGREWSRGGKGVGCVVGKAYSRATRETQFSPFVLTLRISVMCREPVSFMGGMFAGLLRLDMNEDPLKEWVTRTAEASGIVEEEIDADAEGSKTDEVPQQIEIE